MPHGMAVSCLRGTVHERDEHALTLTFLGVLDFHYNSSIVMYTIKLDNIKKTQS